MNDFKNYYSLWCFNQNWQNFIKYCKFRKVFKDTQAIPKSAKISQNFTNSRSKNRDVLDTSFESFELTPKKKFLDCCLIVELWHDFSILKGSMFTWYFHSKFHWCIVIYNSFKSDPKILNDLKPSFCYSLIQMIFFTL